MRLFDRELAAGLLEVVVGAQAVADGEDVDRLVLGVQGEHGLEDDAVVAGSERSQSGIC
jgi:hypothetical protein